MDGNESEQLPVESGHRAELGSAHSGRTRNDGLEDRLNVCRRARDHVQDLACRSLPRERFIALGSALFELAFQRGNGLPETAKRVVEHCHFVSLPSSSSPADPRGALLPTIRPRAAGHQQKCPNWRSCRHAAVWHHPPNWNTLAGSSP
jgi:hypothetical protein